MIGAERFLSEIRVTAGLRHPNILPLFDSGEADSFLFYVMPYVEGESLRDRLDREHQLPVSDAVRIAVSVANALEHAHRKGVVHRDVKPANIMLQDGEPVVADFGIALAVDAGQAATSSLCGPAAPSPSSWSQPTRSSSRRRSLRTADGFSISPIDPGSTRSMSGRSPMWTAACSRSLSTGGPSPVGPVPMRRSSTETPTGAWSRPRSSRALRSSGW